MNETYKGLDVGCNKRFCEYRLSSGFCGKKYIMINEEGKCQEYIKKIS